MKKVSKAAVIFLAVITVLNYLPIILTVVYSFNKSKLSSVWEGFSLDWYKMLLGDGDIKKALLNSIILAFLACVLALIIGVSAALAMRGKKLIFDDFISNFASLPIMIPEIILGMVFMAIFSYMNLPFGFVTMTIAHASFCVPYVFLIVRARLMGMDLSLEEAARDLGASEFETFRDVTLPYILPGIASGLLLSFAMSFDDVVISIFTTGPSVNTLAIKIYTKMKTGITPEINALATVILVITVLIIFISEKTRKD
ncbi:ABC transporter permease [Lachnoanaerobaculum saburreum]|uniref:Putative spermidine/putrescine ABC transporter, permease protein PotC n=1 Tax=Lachnoanaerobaculum saburreum TaxID=467210 RepID=A0A134A0H2_9FIRM|nr:ABC transporter permease [Lachnoanaerobaculum saburreum]KXB61179.1 putative spermidine/putrescine ABC transporter, permease protein PotC [Lachnoanaerobaculum saburreum]